MRNLLRTLLLCCCFASACVLADDSATPIRIGLSVDQSGALAAVGIELRQAAELAVGELNAEYGTGTVELLSEDDRFDPKSAVAAARLFAGVKKVDGAITFGSTTSLAAAPIFEEAHIPTMAIAMSNRVTVGNSYVFQMFLPLEEQARLIIEGFKKHGYKSIGVVNTIQDAMIDVRSAVTAGIPNDAVTIAFEVQPSERDFKTIASRIAVLKPDAVLTLVLGPQIGALTRQLREMGFEGEIFGAMQLGDPAAVAAAGKSLSGAWHSAVNLENEVGLPGKFQKTYGTKPFSETAFAFDSVMLLGKSLIASKRDHAKAADYLRAVRDWKGAAGTFSAAPGGRFSIVGKIDVVFSP